MLDALGSPGNTLSQTSQPTGDPDAIRRRSTHSPLSCGIIHQNGGKPMSMLVSLLVAVLVVGLVLYLLDMLPMDGRMKRIVQLVVLVIAILYLLRTFLVI